MSVDPVVLLPTPAATVLQKHRTPYGPAPFAPPVRRPGELTSNTYGLFGPSKMSFAAGGDRFSKINADGTLRSHGFFGSTAVLPQPMRLNKAEVYDGQFKTSEAPTRPTRHSGAAAAGAFKLEDAAAQISHSKRFDGGLVGSSMAVHADHAYEGLARYSGGASFTATGGAYSKQAVKQNNAASAKAHGGRDTASSFGMGMVPTTAPVEKQARDLAAESAIAATCVSAAAVDAAAAEKHKARTHVSSMSASGAYDLPTPQTHHGERLHGSLRDIESHLDRMLPVEKASAHPAFHRQRSEFYQRARLSDYGASSRDAFSSQLSVALVQENPAPVPKSMTRIDGRRPRTHFGRSAYASLN